MSYPDGVTGNEPEIAGPVYDDYLGFEKECADCDKTWWVEDVHVRIYANEEEVHTWKCACGYDNEEEK